MSNMAAGLSKAKLAAAKRDEPSSSLGASEEDEEGEFESFTDEVSVAATTKPQVREAEAKGASSDLSSSDADVRILAKPARDSQAAPMRAGERSAPMESTGEEEEEEDDDLLTASDETAPPPVRTNAKPVAGAT